jgi:predicted  nucleic acid-binding Zn-ribbon protein
MQHRNKLTGLSVSATDSSVADAKVSALRRDYEYAKAEITRLKLELAQARDELHELEDATSDFVRLML